MATTRDILTRAYRKIGVVAEDEEMSGDQSANGLSALNMMMHGWELFGINVLHADLDVSDEFPLDAKFHEGTVFLLADRLAGDNRQPAPDADMFLRALQAAYMQIETVDLEPSVVFSPSRGRRMWL